MLGSPEPKVCSVAIDGITRYAEGGLGIGTAQKNKSLLMNLNIMKPLIEASQSKQVPVRKAAVTCLAILTETSNIFNLAEMHPDLKRKDLIQSLIQIISKEESVEILDDAAAALANLAKDCAFI